MGAGKEGHVEWTLPAAACCLPCCAGEAKGRRLVGFGQVALPQPGTDPSPFLSAGKPSWVGRMLGSLPPSSLQLFLTPLSGGVWDDVCLCMAAGGKERRSHSLVSAECPMGVLPPFSEEELEDRWSRGASSVPSPFSGHRRGRGQGQPPSCLPVSF